MSEENDNITEAAAPPAIHAALDELFAWMAKHNEPAGEVVIQSKDDPTLHAVLGFGLYHTREDEPAEPAA